MFVAAVCLQPDRSLRITCSERHGRSLLGMDLTRRWAWTTGIAFQACCRTAISIVVERSLDDLARRVHQHHTILTLFSVFNPLCNETKLRCLRFGPCLHNDLSSLSTPLLLFSCNIVAEWNIKVSLHFKKSSSVCEVICMKLRSFCLSEALRRLSVVYFEDKGAKSSIVSQSSPRAHLHVVGMVGFVSVTYTNRACPLLFIPFLRLFLSLWPFQLYFIP